jgi:hypothetical protein
MKDGYTLTGNEKLVSHYNKRMNTLEDQAEK